MRSLYYDLSMSFTWVASATASNSIMAPGLADDWVETILNFSLKARTSSTKWPLWPGVPPMCPLECPLDMDMTEPPILLAFLFTELSSARRVLASITAWYTLRQCPSEATKQALGEFEMVPKVVLKFQKSYWFLNSYKTVAVNDSLEQTHNPASSYQHLKFVWKIVITTGRDCESAEWINYKTRQESFTTH